MSSCMGFKLEWTILFLIMHWKREKYVEACEKQKKREFKKAHGPPTTNKKVMGVALKNEEFMLI